MSHCPTCEADEKAFEARKKRLMQVLPDGTVRPVYQGAEDVWNMAVEACAKTVELTPEPHRSKPEVIAAAIRSLKKSDE